MDSLTMHDDRMHECNCHQCVLWSRDLLHAENEQLRAEPAECRHPLRAPNTQVQP